MYSHHAIADRIRQAAKSQKITIKLLLTNCDLNINTISEFDKGKNLSCFSLAKLADELNCSIDYLMGRTDNPEINRMTTPPEDSQQ